MKRYLIILLFTLCCLGCKRHINEDSIEISASHCDFGHIGGDIRIDIKSTYYWRYAILGNWINVEKISEEECSVKVSPNDSTDREGYVYFICNRDTAYLQITQKHSDIFQIPTDTLKFSYKGGNTTLPIRCYSQWGIKSKSEWIEADINEGFGPHTLYIKVAESDNIDDTTGEITILSENREISVPVLQSARPFVKLEKEVVEIDGDGGNISVLYLSNSDIFLTNDSPWIRTVHHNTTSKTLTLEILSNREYIERVDTVIFTTIQDSSIYAPLSIRQGVKIDHPALSFEEGYRLSVSSRESFTLHPQFTDMKDSSLIWKSDNTEIATVDQSGMVTAQNTGKCKISITNTYHNVSAEIELDIKLKAEKMSIMLGDQDMNTNPIAVRYPGESMTLRVVLTPADSYSGDITFFSSNTEVAKIEGNNIKCISAGTANITVESIFHQLSYTFKIIVIE